MRCLRKDREDRYQNSEQLLADLHHFQQGKHVDRVAVQEHKGGTSHRSIQEVLQSWANRNPEEIMRDVGAIIFCILIWVGLLAYTSGSIEPTAFYAPLPSRSVPSSASDKPYDFMRQHRAIPLITDPASNTDARMQAKEMLDKIAARTKHVDLATVYTSNDIIPNLERDSENISAEAIYLAEGNTRSSKACPSKLFDFVIRAQPPNFNDQDRLVKVFRNEFNSALCHELIPDRHGAARHYNRALALYQKLTEKQQMTVASEVAYASRWTFVTVDLPD